MGSMDSFSDILREATLHKLKLFDSIRGKDIDTFPFWDIVVLTALDESQKEAYEYQVQDKLKRNELPIGVKYHVFSDPVGKKVGNGGSTLDVIDQLQRIYKEKLESLKVLVIHAGGFSQRLPNASLLGKIFMSLPLGDPIYQMLELKLAMYIEFPSRMSSGFFICSADTIEVYKLDGDWTFKEPGFTALGHPSPIEIGTTHGVFVLDEVFVKQLNEKNFEGLPAVMKGTCRKFLHKPGKELMRKGGAVFLNDSEEYIFSDSAFFMDYNTCCHLLEWYLSAKPLQCEIDAYGDFLQALGPEGTDRYCENVKNVTEVTNNLVSTRQRIFHVLRGSQLNVLLMNQSKFYHVGTFEEYIYHFCGYGKFRYELATCTQAMVKGTLDKDRCPDNAVVLHSVVGEDVHIAKDCIVEHSILQDRVFIGRGCILSNISTLPDLRIPENSFLHTICITDEEGPGYVTVCFGTQDNLKKCLNNKEELDALTWYGVKLADAVRICCLSKDLWSSGNKFLNLWHAKLFPLLESPEESSKFAINMLTSLVEGRAVEGIKEKEEGDLNPRYSMAEILELKDLKAQLRMRKDITDIITV